jgi:hypothetical protein
MATTINLKIDLTWSEIRDLIRAGRIETYLTNNEPNFQKETIEVFLCP